MRKSLLTADLAAFVLAAGSASATAASQPGWRVTYLSPDSGYDDFGLYDVTATGPQDAWAVGSQTKGAGSTGALMHWDGQKWSLQLGPEGDFALSASPDGKGGIWYSSFNKTLVHVAKGGTTTTVPVPTPDGRETPEIRQLAGVLGGTTVLAVGEVAPALGGDQSWDALIEQYH